MGDNVIKTDFEAVGDGAEYNRLLARGGGILNIRVS